MPQSIVARKGSVGPYVADLVKNIRNIMAPNTAMHLNEKTCVLGIAGHPVDQIV